MNEKLFIVGIGLILLGIFFIIASAILFSKGEFAVVGFIGPIPFGIASKKDLLIISIVFVIFVVLYLMLISSYLR